MQKIFSPHIIRIQSRRRDTLTHLCVEVSNAGGDKLTSTFSVSPPLTPPKKRRPPSPRLLLLLLILIRGGGGEEEEESKHMSVEGTAQRVAVVGVRITTFYVHYSPRGHIVVRWPANQ